LQTGNKSNMLLENVIKKGNAYSDSAKSIQADLNSIWRMK